MIGTGAAMKRRTSLTDKENRVLGHLLEGKPAWAIAELEGLSRSRVLLQIRCILRKLDRGDGSKSAEIVPFNRDRRD